MRVRSLEELDLDLAWRRVLWRMRRFIDVPDRLPYEVLDRVSAGSPRLEPEHHLAELQLVMATKGSGTARPFTRVNPTDLLLYQALVDALAPAIEASLGPRDRVFAFRQDLTGNENPYFNSPTWSDFMSSVRARLAASTPASPFARRGRSALYALTADITSYFVYIDIDELERRLLAVSDRPIVVRDLGDLLRTWRQLGVRGLPQGLPPSSALGNLYLSRLDGVLNDWDVEYRRYMDDFWVFAGSYSEARRLQDAIERVLYDDGLGLGGAKSMIRRAATALRDTESAEAMIEARREELRDMLALVEAGYASDDELDFDEEEIDEAAVHAEYDEVWARLSAGEYPEHVRSRLIAVFRELEKARDPHALADVPALLDRLPDLTWNALRYVAAARETSFEQAEAAFLGLTGDDRFHRDQEWLHICRAITWFRKRPAQALAERMDVMARGQANPLVRARALLAWGAMSADDDFSLADDLWPQLEGEWKPYGLIAIQRKSVGERDARYSEWGGEARFLRNVADQIRAKPFPWRQL